MKLYPIAFLFIHLCINTYGQSGPKFLDQTIFKKELLNKVWTNEDSDKSKTITLLIFKMDSVSLTYMNWVEGFFEYKCTYTVNIQKNIFKCTMKHCSDHATPSFLYGYIQPDGSLYFNLQEKEMNEQEVLKDTGWIKLKQHTE